MKTPAAPGLALLCATMAAAFLGNAAGCSDRSAQVCDALCDCQGCSNRDYEDCVDDAGDALRRADNQACGAKADAYLGCVESKLQCVDGSTDLSGCEAELADLVACGGAPPSFGSSCELGLKRLKECFGDENASRQFGTCEQPSICGIPCFANVTCEEIQTGQSAEFNKCMTECNGGGGFEGGGSLPPLPPDAPLPR